MSHWGFLILSLLSCSNLKKENSTKVSEPIEYTELDKSKKLVFQGEDIKISNVARSFYDWYINLRLHSDSLIALDIAKGVDNNCTLKNFDNYLNSLKSIGTLSDNFIDSEYKRLLNCKEYLENSSWCFCDTSTFNEVTDDTPCENTFNYWLYNTQELIDDFEIIKYIHTDTSVYVVIAFYTISNNERYEQYFEAEEYLIKEGDKWLIDKIVTRR